MFTNSHISAKYTANKQKLVKHYVYDKPKNVTIAMILI